MNDLHIGIIGIIAGICTTASIIPQILKILKTQKTRDISLKMYILLTTGIFLWMVYGIFIREFPIYAANGVSLILCSSVIVMKLKNKEYS